MYTTELIAENTKDAYSFDRYGSKQWIDITQFLLDAGYNEKMVEEILRSKFTRWGADRTEGEDVTYSTAFKRTFHEEKWFKSGIDKMLVEESKFDPSLIPQ